MTPWFVARYSIHLSYGRIGAHYSGAEHEAPARRHSTGDERRSRHLSLASNWRNARVVTRYSRRKYATNPILNHVNDRNPTVTARMDVEVTPRTAMIF